MHIRYRDSTIAEIMWTDQGLRRWFRLAGRKGHSTRGAYPWSIARPRRSGSVLRPAWSLPTPRFVNIKQRWCGRADSAPTAKPRSILVLNGNSDMRPCSRRHHNWPLVILATRPEQFHLCRNLPLGMHGAQINHSATVGYWRSHCRTSRVSEWVSRV